MFKSLRVQYYKSHKDSILDLHPGINVIVGESYSGKTDLARAFKWLTKARPLGKRFISHFAGKKDKTRVTLSIDDTITVERTRKEYTIRTGDDEISYKGFDKAVPEPVTKILNLSDLNIQDQLDQFFLILDNPSEVARVINTIIGIEKVDLVWVPKITRRINQNNGLVKVLKRDIERIKEELKSFDNLHKMERLVVKAKKNKEDIAEWSDDQFLLEETLETIKRVEKDILSCDKTLKSEKKLIKAEGLVAKRRELIKKEEEVKSSIDYYNEIITSLGLYSHIPEWKKKIDKVEELSKSLDIIEKKEGDLKVSHMRFNDIQNGIEECEETMAEYQEEYRDLIEGFPTCPFCLSEITKSKMKQLIGSLA